MSNRVVSLKKGEDLFLEGDTPDAMYVIKKGRLNITKKKGNTNIVLAELKPGDLLGEMAFFDKSPRSAGACAGVDGTEVIELPFSALDQQWTNLPGWVKSIVKAINGHLRRANIRIRQLERTKEEEAEVFPSFTITKLASILGFISARYGEQTEEGLEIPAGKLRNYTIQIFQEATHKMEKLCDVLQDFGFMTVENLGEGKMKMVVKDLDFIFHFVEFYNNQLFNDNAKKLNISEHQLETLKVAKHYGDQQEVNDKGFVRLNVTELLGKSQQEMGAKMDLETIRSLTDIGILGDLSSDGATDFIEFELKYVSETVPYWSLIYRLKSFKNF